MIRLLNALKELSKNGPLSFREAIEVVQAFNEFMKPIDKDLEQEAAALTFEEHIRGCIHLLAERPEIADFRAVTMNGPEDDRHDEVYWLPSVGYFDGNSNFTSESEQSFFPDEEPHEANAVCIN